MLSELDGLFEEAMMSQVLELEIGAKKFGEKIKKFFLEKSVGSIASQFRKKAKITSNNEGSGVYINGTNWPIISKGPIKVIGPVNLSYLFLSIIN
ncbi:hypothetical protein LKL98_26565, partial [Bacillus pacificus]|nr:hypothetical protein [Bacillus pacificus]